MYLNVLKGVLFPFCFMISTMVTASSSVEMSKDKWFEALKERLPAIGCMIFMQNGTNSQKLLRRKIDQKQCVVLMTSVFDQCQKEYYSTTPALINKDNADQWGRILGQCMSITFQLTYLKPDSFDLKSSEKENKDAWLRKLKITVPVFLCGNLMKDEQARKSLKEHGVDYVQCTKMIPDFFEQCAIKNYANIPALIDVKSADQWGRTLGECVGGILTKNIKSRKLTPSLLN